MIAHLRGRLLHKDTGRAVVEVGAASGGAVGYEAQISVNTFSALPAEGDEVRLHVHTHVREDALALFGFATTAEKQLFEKLIAVSGIGPKLALTVLSGMSPELLVSAIRGNDVAQLTRVPGVGKKTAERMVLELKDKLDAFAASTAPVAKMSAMEEDVASALVNLGYQRGAVEKAMAAVDESAKGKFDTFFRETMGRLRK